MSINLTESIKDNVLVQRQSSTEKPCLRCAALLPNVRPNFCAWNDQLASWQLSRHNAEQTFNVTNALYYMSVIRVHCI